MIIALDFSNYKNMNRTAAVATTVEPMDVAPDLTAEAEGVEIEMPEDNFGSFTCVYTQTMDNPEPVVRQCVAMMGAKCTKNVTAVINGLNCMGSWNFIALMRDDKVIDFRVFDPYREIITRDVRKDNERPGHTFWWFGIGNSREKMMALGMDGFDIETVEEADKVQTRQYLIEELGCNSARQLDLIEEMCL